LVADLPSFTKNLMQTRCSILPSIVDKMTHTVEKALVYKQCIFTAWCHMADWCNRLAEVWPWHSLSSSLTKAVTTITVWELSDSTSSVEIQPLCRIWGSHSSGYEELCLLGYNTV
jgi:hypothetical protein